MNHPDHSYEDCPELQPRSAAPTVAWLEPTPDQLEGARRLLTAMPEPDGFALKYVGSILKRVAAGDFDHMDLRRALAMYRVWDEEVAK